MYGRRPGRAPREAASTKRKALFIQTNPLSPYDAGVRTGQGVLTSYPNGYLTQDFFLSTYSYWPPDWGNMGSTPIAVASEGEGVRMYPFNATNILNWNMRNGNATGLPYGYDQPWTNHGQIWESGLAVGMAGMHSWELWWEINMLPQEFWLMTRKHRKFRITRITCKVTPRGQKKPTVVMGPGQNHTAAKGTVGVGYRVAGDITSGVAYTGTGTDVTIWANNYFANFDVRTYKIPIPLQNIQNKMVGVNWNRWLQLTGLETLLIDGGGITPEYQSYLNYREIILARSRGGKNVKGRAITTRKLKKPKWRMGYGQGGAAAGAQPLYFGGHWQTGEAYYQASTEDPRFIFDGYANMGWIDIPYGGYQPCYQPNTGVPYTQAYATTASWIEPIHVPMMEFVVDASNWPTPWITWPSSTQNLTNPWQDFTVLTEPDSSAAQRLNPPLLYDVTYETEVEFIGENDYNLMGQQALLPGKS